MNHLITPHQPRERGHVSYNRRLILPLTARIMVTAFPEIVALAAFPVNVLDELPLLTDPKRLPECVHRQSFVA